MAAIDILMPALSPTMEEGALAKWLVKAGDRVTLGDVIAEIETDKATLEVEAVHEGIIAEILVAAGSEGVKVNTPIARLGAPANATEAPPPEHAARPPAGLLPAETLRPQAPDSASAGDHALASPLARKLAAAMGTDLSGLKGSGPQGRILKADLQPGRSPPAPAGPALGDPGRSSSYPATLNPAQPYIAPVRYALAPLDAMRRTVARRMADSFRDAPHFPVTIDLEVDALIEARARLNARLQGVGAKISLTDMLIRAAAVALVRTPQANTSFTPEGLAQHHHADIAVAVAAPGGLVSPIIRAAETKGVGQIACEAKVLADRARRGALRPDEYEGGTFTISNLGMFGVKRFSSVLNPPQACILSVGAGEKCAVARHDKIEIATVMSVTLTCDHRAVDGAIAAEWLSVFKGLVEDPMMMIA